MKIVKVTVAFYDSQDKIIGTDFVYTTPSMVDQDLMQLTKQ